MAHNIIDIVDKDFVQCIRKAMPRQIRFKSSSYDSIFSQFKKKLYEKKMDRVIDKTLSTTYTDSDLKDKLSVSSEKIANLESKIRKLSMEDIPSKYVKSRAIKLRNYMMDNTLRNSAGLYLIDLTKDDIVSSKDDSDSVSKDVLKDNSSPIDNVIPTGQIDLKSDNLNKDEISNIINGEFKNLEDSADESMTKFVSPEEVRDAVGFNPSINQTSDFDEETGKSDSVTGLSDTNGETEDSVIDVFVDTKDAEEPISEKNDSLVFNDPVVESDSSHNESLSGFDQDASVSNKKVSINFDDIKGEIDNAINNIKVSTSESSVAKVDKFDDQGNIRFKDSYTPMSDEEIVESQEKINSVSEYEDKSHALPSGDIFEGKVSFENLFIPADSSVLNIKPDTAEEKRDIPVVVTPRNEISQNVDNNIVEYRFDDESSDFSQDSDQIEDNTIKRPSRLDEISILKAKALELQKKRKEIDKRMVDAQKSAVEKSKKAQAAKESADASVDELNGKIEEFRLYCAGLERDNAEMVRETEIFQNDIQMNNNFIQIQNNKASENFEMIDEINRIMSGSKGSHSK